MAEVLSILSDGLQTVCKKKKKKKKRKKKEKKRRALNIRKELKLQL